MTPDDTFGPWLKRARAFERRAYHTGLHAKESQRVTCDRGEKLDATQHRVSTLAWRAYKAGLVILFQRRVASHQFTYEAVRTFKPASDALLLELVGA